jgi:hypothetical protein
MRMSKGTFILLLKIFPKDIALEIITFVDISVHFDLVKKLCEEIHFRVPYIIRANPQSFADFYKEACNILMYYNGNIIQYGYVKQYPTLPSFKDKSTIKCIDFINSNGAIIDGHSQGIKKVINFGAVSPNIPFEKQCKDDWAGRMFVNNLKKKVIKQINQHVIHKDTLPDI